MILVGLNMFYTIQAQNLWINEIDYDIPGAQDTTEFVEVAGLVGTDLSKYQLIFINGTNLTQYYSMNLSGTLQGTGNIAAKAFYLPTNTFQNGAPDGLALIKNDTVLVQFISYEGKMDNVSILGKDYSSDVISVSDANTANSLQLTGAEVVFPFNWELTNPTPNQMNVGQQNIVITNVNKEESAFDIKYNLNNRVISTINPVEIDVFTIDGKAVYHGLNQSFKFKESGVYIVWLKKSNEQFQKDLIFVE